MNSELEELYQEVILDHSRRPRNFGSLADAAVRVHGDNPSCGDEIDLGVKFGPDGSLQEIKFSGHGCAISQASASMMTMKLKGKSPAAARETGRIPRFGCWRGRRCNSAPGRPALAPRSAKVSAAGQVRDARLARAGGGAAARRRRRDGFHGSRCR
jgi:hypothetical protein